MKKILIIGVLVSFIFSVLMVGGVFATKDEIIFEAPNGKVTFNHKNTRKH